MKKIFILSILVMPVMANADNVGPSAASGTPVIPTANAPYATVGAVNGDTTHVVTASYVKEAYNDTIAAVNKVNADKQDKLKNGSNNHTISSNVVAGSGVRQLLVSSMAQGGVDKDEYNFVKSSVAQEMGVQNLDDALISADVFFDVVQELGQNKSDRIMNIGTGDRMGTDTISVDNLDGVSFTNNYNTFHSNMNTVADGELDNVFISADGVITLVKTAVDEVQGINDSKRVRALTTWGQNTTALIPFANAQ